MTKAVLGVGFDGDEAESGLDKIDKKLGDVDKTAQSLSARFKALQSLWKDPVGAGGKWDWSERMGASVAKASVDIIRSQVGAAADAVIAPAKTSYAGAIAVANSYRDTTQRIATSTGRNYFEISAQIDSSAKRLGILPDRVSAYAMSVRNMTGDWHGAVDGLEAYQDRALQTGRTIEQLGETQAKMTALFGMTGTEQVNKFYGTMNAQAKAAGISTERLEKTFMEFAGEFARFSAASPQRLSALTSSILGAAPNAVIGEGRVAATAGLMHSKMEYADRRMRGSGLIKKGEHLYDENFQLRPEMQEKYLGFLQKDLGRHYGTKDPMELAARMERSGLMSGQDAIGFLRLNPKTIEERSRLGGAPATALADDMKSEAGKRKSSEVNKNIADRRLGDTLLGAQDAAVGAGGGAAGVAFAASGEIFNKATGVFSDAVRIFMGAASKGGGGAGSAVGSFASGAAGSGVPGALKGLARFGPYGILAAGVVAAGVGTYYAAGENAKEEEGKQQERDASQQQGFSDVKSMHFFRQRFDMPDIAPSTTATGKADLEHPIKFAPEVARDISDAMVKALSSQTLRVQAVQQAGASPGQGQPP